MRAPNLLFALTALAFASALPAVTRAAGITTAQSVDAVTGARADARTQVVRGSHALAAVAQAESGPVVPCDDCAGQQLFDAPSSGLWSNPDAPGTKLDIVMQDGLLIGTWYGHNADGSPQWYQFRGKLQRPAQAPHLLRLAAPLERYESGACLGCTYRHPRKFLDAGQIVLEFDQRNHGTYAIGDGARTHIVPQVFGVPVAKEFSNIMHYDLPDLAGPWLLTFRVQDHFWPDYTGGREGTFTGSFDPKTVVNDSGGHPVFVQWQFSTLDSYTGDAYYVARVACGWEEPASDAALKCSFDIATLWDRFPEFQNKRFPLPYANIGAGRIVSQDPETGIRLEAFRLDYD